MTKKTIGDRLAELKARSGLSLADLARLAGYKGPSSLQRYFQREYDPYSLDYLLARKLAGAMNGAGTPPITEYEVMVLTDRGAIDGEIDTFVRQAKFEKSGLADVYGSSPVLYTINLPDQKLEMPALKIFMGEPEKSFSIPPFVERRQVFGVYNSGEAMTPRYEDGEIIFTDGRTKPVKNDHVLLVLDANAETDETIAAVGRLEWQDWGGVRITQIHGETYDIPNAFIAAMRRVMRAENFLE